MGLVIATDIGGMFTDMVAFDTDSKTTVHAKSHTDPGDLTGGIIRCLQKSGLVLSEATDFVRGSTVAINTAIERKGAVTALIVTRGMRDVYAIGRGNRPEAYNLFFERPEPFVPRSRIIEIDERLDAAGNVVTPLDPQSVRTRSRSLSSDGRSPCPHWHWDPLLAKACAVAVRVGAEERIDPLREAIIGFSDSGQFMKAVLPAL
jgi:N-methylhydantoinase A